MKRNKTSSSSYLSVPYHSLNGASANQSYEGIVRSAQMIAAGQNRSRVLWQYGASSRKVNGLAGNGGTLSSQTSNLTHVHLSEEEAIVQASQPEQQQPQPAQPASPTSSSSSSSSSNSFGQLRSPSSSSTTLESYSTQPLLIAITIGCALLLLNVVVCSALYRQCRLNRQLITDQTRTATTTNAESGSAAEKVKLNSKCANSAVGKQSNCPTASSTLTRNATSSLADNHAKGSRSLNCRSPQVAFRHQQQQQQQLGSSSGVHEQHQLGPSVSLLSSGGNNNSISGGTLSRRGQAANHHQLSQLSTPAMFPLETLKNSSSTGESSGGGLPQPPQLLMLNSTASPELSWTNSCGQPTFLNPNLTNHHQNHQNQQQQQQQQTYFCLVPDTGGPTNTFI